MNVIARSFLSSVLLVLLAWTGGAHAQDTVEVRAASLAYAGDPTDIFWHRLRDNLNGHKDTRLRLTLLTRGQLGTEENIMPALRRGRVQLASFTTSGMETAVPEFGVFLAPYLFQSFAEVDFVLDRYLTEFITGLCADAGIEMLAWYDEGWRSLYAQKPLADPDAIRNYRMRAMQSRASQLFLQTMGADVIPLPFTDVIPGLDTGLIHGGETGTYFYAATGITKQAAHYTLTEHAYSLGVITANKSWFEGLTQSDQRAVRDSVPPVSFVRELMRSTARRTLEQLPAQQVRVYSLSGEQRVRWRARSLVTHQVLIDRIGGRAEELYALIQEGRRAFAAR